MQLASSVRRLSALSTHLSSPAGDKCYDYDLVVVGGGSGGLACSKEAAGLGKKVAVLDYVTPSPRGNSWGLGGTCVNVGCIPKKLMHQAALLGQAIKDSSHYGWSVPQPVTHSWSHLTAAINDHIKSLNWGHRVQLKQKEVDYINARGAFIDAHTLESEASNGTKVPGAVEYGVTSDDLFTLPQPPGRTLDFNLSYRPWIISDLSDVALECAGFLAGLGYDTTLMIRSSPLKGFDQDVVDHVMQHLEHEVGTVRVMRRCEPREVRRGRDGRDLTVSWHDSTTNQNHQDTWDTVLFATGRSACTGGLGLSRLQGVAVHPQTGKVIVNEHEATGCGNVFAIGDVASSRWELTPVAIKAGKLLAQRLFGASQQLMDYARVPVTIFTPLELSSIGMAEEEAVAVHGQHNIEVYHALYTPVEFQLPRRAVDHCYIKMVCFKDAHERLLGLHLTGPNAGEVAQGFSVAMRCGLSRASLLASVGIHPTCAEELTKLHITKHSGLDARVTSC